MKFRLLSFILTAAFLTEPAMAYWDKNAGCFGTPDKDRRNQTRGINYTNLPNGMVPPSINSVNNTMNTEYVSCVQEYSDLVDVTRKLMVTFRTANQTGGRVHPTATALAGQSLKLWNQYLNQGVTGKSEELKDGAKKTMKFQRNQRLRRRKKAEREAKVKSMENGILDYNLDLMRNGITAINAYAMLADDSLPSAQRNRIKNQLEKRYKDLKNDKHEMALPVNIQVLGGVPYTRANFVEALDQLDWIRTDRSFGRRANYCEMVDAVVRIESMFWEKAIRDYLAELQTAQAIQQLSLEIKKYMDRPNGDQQSNLNYENFGAYIQNVLVLWNGGTGSTDADAPTETAEQIVQRLRGEFDRALYAMEIANGNKCGGATGVVPVQTTGGLGEVVPDTEEEEQQEEDEVGTNATVIFDVEVPNGGNVDSMN